MNSIKSFVRRLIERQGYHVIAKSFMGLDSMADFKKLLEGVKEPVVLDVGGFLGGFAHDVTTAFPGARVHSFEPVPDSYRQLVENTRGRPNVTPVNLAVGAEPGEIEFNVNSGPATSSALEPADGGRRNMPPGCLDRQAVRKVRVARLDDYAAEHGLDRIDLLKTDTQGYELQVLLGAERLLAEGRVKLLFVEVFFQEFYKGQCYYHDIDACLRRHRMAFCGFYDPTRSPRGDLLWADALYMSPA